MTNRELLEKAAKAAGYELQGAMSHGQGFWLAPIPGGIPQPWNPFASDGDALRLAVRLRLHVDHGNGDVTAWICSVAGVTPFTEESTTPEATRRSIVRAAAAMADARGGEKA